MEKPKNEEEESERNREVLRGERSKWGKMLVRQSRSFEVGAAPTVAVNPTRANAIPEVLTSDPEVKSELGGNVAIGAGASAAAQVVRDS